MCVGVGVIQEKDPKNVWLTHLRLLDLNLIIERV